MRAGDRATEFKQRCVGLGIQGVSLHSYRYAWAERAKTAGYPERFAQMALGHNSKAVHRAYAKKAQVTLPPLEEYEQKVVQFIKRGNHPTQIQSLAYSGHLRMSQIIGNGANRTFGAVPFTRIPAEEARMEAHTMRMGYRVTLHPYWKQ